MKMAKTDFNGEIVEEMLKRVASLLTGAESDYDKINIKNYLDKCLTKKARFYIQWKKIWMAGRDWWVILLPVAKMSQKELAEKQKEANNKMTETWSVRDNTIVFNGKRGKSLHYKGLRRFLKYS